MLYSVAVLALVVSTVHCIAIPRSRVSRLVNGLDKREDRPGRFSLAALYGGGRRRNQNGRRTQDSSRLSSDDEGGELSNETESDDVYDLAHFFYNVEDLIFDEIDGLNSTLFRKLMSGEEHISELEHQLEARDERIEKLEEDMRHIVDKEGPRDPFVGQVRLIAETKSALWTKGRLLIYAGKDLGWGFVCDDMFYRDSARVACKQLGYLTGLLQSGRVYDLAETTSFELYSIVLDDVHCDYGDLNLMSCTHAPLGVHNCELSEAVDVMCFK